MFNNVHRWLADYVCQIPLQLKQRMVRGPVHVVFSVVDHFEPRQGGVSPDQEVCRVKRFLARYKALALKHKDSSGVPPKYTFFYPIDEYTVECVDLVGAFCREGYGELEVHLHHDNDTPESLRRKLLRAVDVFKGHGLLSTDKLTGQTQYGFIHGNWALCNSRKDGRWCGVDSELTVLKETGCYADFTLPSAPSETQARKINSIYYAASRPGPRSHDFGIAAAAGRKASGDLLLIQGPLLLDWQRGKIENGALVRTNPVTPARVRLWLSAGVQVRGRPDVIFVKVHNHGCREDHLTDSFFANLDWMFGHLEEKYNDGRGYQLHYMSAREMYNVVKALESGASGDPSRYRDHVLLSNVKQL